MGRRDVKKKSAAEQPENEENTDGWPTHVQGGGASSNPYEKDISLANVLEEIRDFRKDKKEQLIDIKSELTNVHQK